MLKKPKILAVVGPTASGKSALAEELARERDEFFGEDEVIEEELSAEIEEVYDDEEFIEQAPNPYYSLEEEENVYAFDEEETERVSDVDTAGQETEETPYDNDPFDGVFGAARGEDSTADDEAGYSGDEYAYAGAYEYADEADAQTENADRETPSSQGSVDPYAYVVNDETGEAFEEDDLYRYDE